MLEAGAEVGTTGQLRSLAFREYERNAREMPGREKERGGNQLSRRGPGARGKRTDFGQSQTSAHQGQNGPEVVISQRKEVPKPEERRYKARGEEVAKPEEEKLQSQRRRSDR